MTFGFIAATVSAVGGAATATTTTASGDLTGAIPSVVTSSAQNGSELFEVNLRDDRYLPFERAGVISMWRLDLPSEIAPFDFEGSPP